MKHFKHFSLIHFFSQTVLPFYLLLIPLECLWSTELKVYSENPVIGQIGKQSVEMEELRNKKIYDLSLELYQKLQEQFILYSLKILEKKHDIITTSPEVTVTEQQILTVYKNNNLNKRGTLDEFRLQIVQFLKNRLRQQKMLAQYAMALEKGWITSYLSPPSQFIIKAPIKTAFIRGNPKASVMVLEFSDYQCHYCSRIQNTVSELVKNYGKTVAFGYRHFPLEFHTEADESAIAVECAREQNKFIEMHQILYKNQKAQFSEHLKKYARKIGIKNLKKFDQCIESERYRGLLDQDIADGASLGITGTPGFLIGQYDPATRTIHGEILSGAQPLSAFEALISKYMQKNDE